MNTLANKIEPGKAKRFIWVVSILIPVAVTVLFFLPAPDNLSAEAENFFRSLPPFYATLNALTALALVLALVAIKKKNVKLHMRLMTLSMIFSALFLVCYVAYHLTIPRTEFGGEGAIKTVYFIILASHILLSVIIIPLVLVSYVRGFAGLYEKHKKIAKITFPIWLYVAITGVVVYLMISPYYPV